MVLVLLAFNADTRIALYVTPVWVLVMVIGYFASRAHHTRLTPVHATAETHAHKPKPPKTSGPTVGPTATPA